MRTLLVLVMAALLWPTVPPHLRRPKAAGEPAPLSHLNLPAPAPTETLQPLPISPDDMGAVAYELDGEALSPERGRVAVKARLLIAPMAALMGATDHGSLYLFPAWIEMNVGDAHVAGRNVLGTVAREGNLRFPEFAVSVDGAPGTVILTMTGGAPDEATLEDDLDRLDLYVTGMPFKIESDGAERITWLGDFHHIRRVS